MFFHDLSSTMIHALLISIPNTVHNEDREYIHISHTLSSTKTFNTHTDYELSSAKMTCVIMPNNRHHNYRNYTWIWTTNLFAIPNLCRFVSSKSVVESFMESSYMPSTNRDTLVVISHYPIRNAFPFSIFYFLLNLSTTFLNIYRIS